MSLIYVDYSFLPMAADSLVWAIKNGDKAACEQAAKAVSVGLGLTLYQLIGIFGVEADTNQKLLANLV